MVESGVCAIGRREIILPFRAAGVVLYPAADGTAVTAALREISASPAGLLVLITEEAALSCPEAIDSFEEAGRHSLVIIPRRKSEKSLALERIRERVIHSVGVDLISKAAIRGAPTIEHEEGVV